MNFLAVFNLIMGIVSAVRDVEKIAEGNGIKIPGVEKANEVINRVAPYAETVKATLPQVQQLIDAAVTLFHLSGIFTRAASNGIDAPANTTGTDAAA